VSNGEFREVLAGGRGYRDAKTVVMLPSSGFVSELFEIGKMTPSGEEVVHQTHDEIADRDATIAFLNRAALQIFLFLSVDLG
jgi:hypothetical protein